MNDLHNRINHVLAGYLCEDQCGNDKANPCVICLERTIPLTDEVITAAGLVEERVIDGRVMWRDDDDTCPTGVGRWIRGAAWPTDPGYYRYGQNNWKHDADD